MAPSPFWAQIVGALKGHGEDPNLSSGERAETGGCLSPQCAAEAVRRMGSAAVARVARGSAMKKPPRCGGFEMLAVGAVIREPVSPALFPETRKFAGNGAEITLVGALPPSAKPRQCWFAGVLTTKFPCDRTGKLQGRAGNLSLTSRDQEVTPTARRGVIWAPQVTALGATISDVDRLDPTHC